MENEHNQHAGEIPENQRPSYRGNMVRYLFFGSALLLLLNITRFTDSSSFTLLFVIISIVILVIAAGFTTHLHRYGVVIDFIISTMGFIIAVTSALAIYGDTNTDSKLFGTYMFISIMMLFAIYFSIRTMLRLFSGNNIPPSNP